MNKAIEQFVDALYYYEMFESPAWCKTISVINEELRGIGSKIAKLRAFIDNMQHVS